MTNNQLLVHDMEINQMNSTHRLFHQGRIKNFYDKYEGMLRLLKGKVNLLQDEYFDIKDGKIQFDGEGKDAKPVFKEGKTMEEYNKQYNSLMIIPIK